VAAALVITALVAGCGSTANRSSSAPTTATASPSKAPYAARGPYAVGYTTATLAGGRRVVIWYPADPGKTAGHAQETIDLVSLLSPALQAKVPATDRVLYSASAYRDAPPATSHAPYPIVLFSHGFAGYPEQSVSLTTHLASWGFVVAAPDHVERSLDGLLGTAAKGVPKSTDTAVLAATLDLVTRDRQLPDDLHGLVDPTRVAVIGHSAGAGAAYAFASSDPRIRSWISYSVGFGGQSGPAPKAPDKPGMVMLGTKDGIIPPVASRQVYAGMHTPKYLAEIGGAGHLVFSDICLIARSKGGITGIAKAIHLPIPPSLLKLGSDGCTSDHPDPAKAFPAIDQLSVAFLRWSLGLDPQPVGLSTDAVDGLGAQVTVQHAG
jgi:predicted dienelactone hydrolase